MPSAPKNFERAEPLVRALLVGVLCALPAFFCFQAAGTCVADPDLGWHLRTGQWILEHRAFPRVDPFSRVTGGNPWQAYSWLFDLLLWKAYTWLGLSGVVALTAAMMSLTAAATYRMISRLNGDFTEQMLLTAAVVVSLGRLSSPRPWLVTVLFFVLELDILMDTRGEGRSRRLVWLPVMFAVWANVHIQFIDGLVALGLATLEPLLARWWKSDAHCARPRDLGLALGASAAAACLNPYGPRIYAVAWKLASQPGVLNTVVGERALTFRFFEDFLLLFLALAAAGVLFRYRNLPPFETLMLAAAAVLSFRSRRDVWWMAFTAAAILAAGLPRRQEESDRESRSGGAVALSTATAIAFFTAGTLWTLSHQGRLESALAEKMPVHAVEVIKARHLTGAVFNPYDWGGFLIWQLGEPVSIDGRAALYGDERIDRSLATWGGGPAWASDPDLRSAGVVIAPRGAALTQLLAMDRRFDLTYEDAVAALFVAGRGARESAATQAGAQGNRSQDRTGVTPPRAASTQPR